MKPKKNIIYLATIAVLSGLLLLSYLSTPAIAQPGTSSDPLVTQRYVDDRIAELQAQINALQGGQAGTGTGGGVSQVDRNAIVNEVLQAMGESQVVPFTPLFIPRGQRLIANAGAEFILRSGTAYVIAGPNGLVDATAGRDVGNGQQVSRNHLMLVPATDGRGLYFASDAWLMIKGGFIIAN
ncbi:MAG: hypothetical protein FWE42_08675 [Defluviitaleaceae bacterium]|nr:hypothetical protein [Defluviitaleaceae bacterium]